MTTCPKCGSVLYDDFGYSFCPKCSIKSGLVTNKEYPDKIYLSKDTDIIIERIRDGYDGYIFYINGPEMEFWINETDSRNVINFLKTNHQYKIADGTVQTVVHIRRGACFDYVDVLNSELMCIEPVKDELLSFLEYHIGII